MEIILICILGAMLLGFGIALILLLQRVNDLKNTTAVELVKGDVVELSRSIATLQQSMGEKLDRSQQATQQSVQKHICIFALVYYHDVSVFPCV